MIVSYLSGFFSLLLLISPYLGNWKLNHHPIGFEYYNTMDGWYKIVIVLLGSSGLFFFVYNSILSRKTGFPHIVIGLVGVAISYFYNEESLSRLFVPSDDLVLGGALFLASNFSVALVILGFAQEFLDTQLIRRT